RAEHGADRGGAGDSARHGRVAPASSPRGLSGPSKSDRRSHRERGKTMIEPRRLREEGGSALELALLDAGRTVAASTRTRTRALAALGLAAGPIAAAVVPTQAV